MNKDSRINYERNLRLIFMEYVAFKIAENSIWDFKELDSFLSEFISGNNRRKKAVTMLKKIWLPKNRIQNQLLSTEEATEKPKHVSSDINLIA